MEHCDKPVSLILPLYNEEANIEEVVSSVLNFFNERKSPFEIILVNDGSSDRTPFIIEKLAKENKYVRAVHHHNNKGYGVALTSGFNVAQYEIVAFMDGDGQFEISDIDKLLIYNGDYDIVVGYRMKRQDPFYRIIMGKAYTRLIYLLFGVSLKDVNCGFKIFKKPILNRIHIFSNGGLVSAEILVRAKNIGCNIKEAGVNHFRRLAGKQSGASFGVLVNGIYELWNLFMDIRLRR